MLESCISIDFNGRWGNYYITGSNLDRGMIEVRWNGISLSNVISLAIQKDQSIDFDFSLVGPESTETSAANLDFSPPSLGCGCEKSSYHLISLAVSRSFSLPEVADQGPRRASPRTRGRVEERPNCPFHPTVTVIRTTGTVPIR